jgi:proteasome accessory factor B
MKTQLINRTERLAAIEQMLLRSDSGLRVVEIAQTCGVDRRTIYRDLSLLSDIGVPIFQKEGRFFINRDYYLANVRLSVYEAIALYLAVRILTQHAEQQNPHLISALRKLSYALPEPVASHVAYLVESASDPVDPGYVSALEALIRAWGERRKVKLWYTPLHSHEATAREFAIYFIESTPSGQLYVVGYDFLSQRVRHFLMQRVKRVKLLRAIYDIPAHFSPRRYLSSRWGMLNSGDMDEADEVVLRFSPEAAPLIRDRIWHVSQRVEPLENGGCVLGVETSDWHEMLAWIRSWGAQVEVVHPQALREYLANEAANIATLYQASSHDSAAEIPGAAKEGRQIY